MMNIQTKNNIFVISFYFTLNQCRRRKKSSTTAKNIFIDLIIIELFKINELLAKQ